jgi:hypothetical protein
MSLAIEQRNSIGPGEHLLGSGDGTLVSHLMWVTRWLQPGSAPARYGRLMKPPSRRARFVVLALCTIGIGMLVRARGEALGPVARDVIGDALWAVMMVWWVGAVAPRARLAVRSATAYLICVGVELSQLYHAPALDAARATPLGHLVLGSGFEARDLAAYALGVLGAGLLDATRLNSGAPRDRRLHAERVKAP